MYTYYGMQKAPQRSTPAARKLRHHFWASVRDEHWRQMAAWKVFFITLVMGGGLLAALKLMGK